jgi:hypothetical protein
VISTNALALLRGAGMSDRELRDHFDATATDLILGGGSAGTSGWRALRVRSYSSEAALESDVMLGRVHADAVLYDNEAWPLTPLNEQQHPALYEARAAAVAHAHGLQLIATPGVDLVRALEPGYVGSRFSEYVRLGIAADAARYADAIDIQGQSIENDIAAYTAFVQQASAQARAANPGVRIVAGLSTNPHGLAVTAAQLEAAVAATGNAVAGYWLTIPSGGPACPSCGAPQPQIAVQLLRALPIR